jgi:hypothetical protein
MREETMSNRRQAFRTANLLALLEATSMGLVGDVTEEERVRACEIAERVAEIESRRRRAHRRPSCGRSKPLRGHEGSWGGRE